MDFSTLKVNLMNGKDEKYEDFLAQIMDDGTAPALLHQLDVDYQISKFV